MQKRFITLAFLGVAMFGLMGATQEGCEPTADDKDREAQEQMLKNGQAQTGLPAIVNWTEKKNFKRILELRDQANLETWTYITDMNGGLHPLGPWGGRSIGLGISGAVQFTSPMKYAGQGLSLPQADPNGLFSPPTDEGTYIILVDNNGEQVIVRAEPRTIVSTKRLM